MIGMVLVTHGGLAAEFVAALEHIVEETVNQVAIVPIGPEDDMEQRRNELLQKVSEVDTGEGVVVLTDMFGGTPVQPGDFDSGSGQCGSCRRGQSADADPAQQSSEHGPVAAGGGSSSGSRAKQYQYRIQPAGDENRIG